ncbi:MAG: penicillin acylase family protein [Acidimicrobiales bacterium]|jgi:penicillin amidase
MDLRRTPVARGLLPVVAATAVLLSATFVPSAGAGASRLPTAANSGSLVGHGSDEAVITRNSFGVPTITSSTLSGMWFGAGYAQAEDRMVQLELVRRTVEGTLSAIGGPGELAQDEDIRTFFYTPGELQAQYRSMPAATRAALKAFSDGINAYETVAFKPQNQQARVPYEFFVIGSLLGSSGPYQPAPWRPIDTVAIGDYLAREFGGGGGNELSNLAYLRYLSAYLTSTHDPHPAADARAVFNDTLWINDPTAPTTVPSAATASSTSSKSTTLVATEASLAALASITTHDILQAAATLRADRERILQTGVQLKVPSHGGSNAFVVSPFKSKDHHALLWGAPQEGFGTPSIDYEEYLHGPNYDAGGMAITGEPFLLIGRNADLAWTTTSEELVDQRIYTEQVQVRATPPSYYYDGKWTPLQVVRESIPVLGSKPVHYTVYRTIDGPIFYLDAKDGVAFSMRFASWEHETGSLVGFSQLGGDTNLHQFAASMKLVTTLHNFLYADRRGNIAYFGDGLVPTEPSFSKVDPRLPALGDGTEQWTGYVPWSKMPRSINPAQGYLDNWNTKPSQSQYYQQNNGDEYWGTIFRSSQISKMLAENNSISVPYLESIEHSIGQIDNGDNTRPAASYFIPFLEQAYKTLVAEKNPLVSSSTHPDLAIAMRALASWNDVRTLGSPAMSIFMNTLEALEANVCEGGLNPGETYVGAINMNDAALGLGTYGGLGSDCTYNFLYHVLAHTPGIVPCGVLCYHGSYFSGEENEILVESVNDAITILSGTGRQLGQDVPGFGTTDVAEWGYQPALDTNWDNLDPFAAGYSVNCGSSPSQNRSTFMMAIDVGPKTITGADVLPPGESGFLGADGTPSPHLCDQVKLFDTFHYKQMPPA